MIRGVEKGDYGVCMVYIEEVGGEEGGGDEKKGGGGV